MTNKTSDRKTREVHRFNFDDGSVTGELEKYYWVDDRQLSQAFGSNIPPRLADLVDLAMAVYHADRRAPRVRNPLVLTGQRDLRINLPLRDLEFWKKREVTDRLTDVLYWFTEDQWTFTFVPRRGAPRLAETESYLFPSPVNPPVAVVLFSGGLDSLAGLCTQLEKYPDHSFVLLSGWTHNRTAHLQRNLVKDLRRYWQSASREVRSVAVPFGLRRPQGATREEPSQRSRGFVFLVLGAIAAVMAKSHILWVHENGVGAVNLWLNEGQLGVDSARGVHPLSLIRMTDFLSLILQQSPLIENPEKIDPPDCYRNDIKRSVAGARPAQLYPLQATLDHVDRLSACLESEAPWVTLTETFPELREVHEEMVRCRGASAQEIAEPMSACTVRM